MAVGEFKSRHMEERRLHGLACQPGSDNLRVPGRNGGGRCPQGIRHQP
jgi:hypothetical protein